MTDDMQGEIITLQKTFQSFFSSLSTLTKSGGKAEYSLKLELNLNNFIASSIECVETEVWRVVLVLRRKCILVEG